MHVTHQWGGGWWFDPSYFAPNIKQPIMGVYLHDRMEEELKCLYGNFLL